MGQPMITERVLTDDDIREARAMTGFTFWAGPVISIVAVSIPLVLLSMRTIDKLLGLILLAWFGLYAGFTIIPRLRQYGQIRNDLAAGIVKTLEASPEKVWLNRRGFASGFAYARFLGLNLRVPNDMYHEISDANLVRVSFLPTSLVAVNIEVEHGIGLAASNRR